MAGVGVFISWLTSFSEGKARFYKEDLDLAIEQMKVDQEEIIELKKELDELRGRVVSQLSAFDDANEQHARTQSDAYNLQKQLNAARDAQVIAEARVTDLRDALRIERERFDQAVKHEREVDHGMRVKIGLAPREDGPQTATEVRPLQTRRQPWNQVQRQVEEEAKTHSDKMEEHWRKKIAEVEEKDKRAGHTGNTDTAQESGEGSKPNPDSDASTV